LFLQINFVGISSISNLTSLEEISFNELQTNVSREGRFLEMKEKAMKQREIIMNNE